MDTSLNNATENSTFNINWTTYNIHLWVVPIICLLGIGGNILCMIVCYNSRLRHMPSSLYLCALAAADSLYLIAQLIMWLPMVGVDTLSWHVVCCWVGFQLNVSAFVSAWSVAVFTFERFFVVHYPLQRARICTVYKAKCILLALLVIAVVLNVHTFVILESTPQMPCSPKEHLHVFNLVMGVIDTVLSYVLPLVAICTFNFLIAKKLFKANADVGTEQGSGLRRHGAANRTVSQQQEHSVTRMLLIVSTVFVIFNFLSYFMRIKVQFLAILDAEDRWTGLDQKMEFIGFMLNLINYAIDFLLYNLSSKNFQKIAAQVLLHKCRKGVLTSRGTMYSTGTAVTSL